jgi:hypothetical protein
MPSQLCSEAARRNGARPNGECTERFTALHNSLFERLQPEGPIELVENMVVCRWRQLRLWVMEKSALNHEMRKQAAANRGEGKPTRAALAYRIRIEETKALTEPPAEKI